MQHISDDLVFEFVILLFSHKLLLDFVLAHGVGFITMIIGFVKLGPLLSFSATID